MIRLVLNLIWFVLAGFWLAIAHVVTGVAPRLTIIGVPFGWANIKLAAVALFPLGKVVVSSSDPRVTRGVW